MKSKIFSRREFLNNAALVVFATSLSSCTKTVTKYRPDGTPYTEEVEDWMAIALLFIVLGALAAARSSSGSSQNDEDERKDPLDEEGEIRFASMTSKSARPVRDTKEGITIKDSKGTLLIMADASEHVTYCDSESGKSLLTLAQISDLQKPILIRLKQDDLNSYSIEQIHPLRKPLNQNNFKVFHRLVREELYEIKVHDEMDGYMDLEITLGASSKSIA